MNSADKRFGYIIAIVACALVLVSRLALDQALAEQARLMPFVLAVMAAAGWGGLGPGLLATALSVFLGVLFVLPPPFSLQVDTLADALNAAIFIVIGVTISILCDALHAARRRETEKQFHSLADSMPQLVWMARPDGFRFWYNQRWHDYTGVPSQQPNAFDWQDYCAPAELPRVLASWSRAISTGEPWEETYPLRRHDGQMRWHLARAVPVRNGHGEIVCWFGTSTDIENRIEVEQSLKDADARKDQFLAMLAHELRNPLSPLSNALQLWPHVADDKAELEHLRSVMERQVRQLIHLIDDLMDVSRITRGKINLRRRRVSLQTLIGDAVEAVRPMVDENAHELIVSTPRDPIYIDGDATRLTQVFSNILNNAAKYSVRHGRMVLTAEMHDGQAVVKVRDNGPGIPPHLLEEVFEPFRQVDRTLDRSCGGLGIGLWLTRQLVGLHGGTVQARSEGLGKGTEIVVTLPISTAPTCDEHLDPAPPAIVHNQEIPRHRVLVVDDLRESAETLAMVLQSLGQDATAMHDAAAAIAWIREHRPDIVFLDIAMPRLDGYEVARLLYEHGDLHHTVLIALTGYGQPADRRRALEAGFNFHLTKPTNMATLRDLLLKLPASTALVEASAP